MDTAVILAGGFGTRLRHLTDNIPKPLLPVAGKPVLEWTLDHLRNYNIKRVIFALHHNADKIKEHFGNEYNGIRLEYYIEEKPLGTAGIFNILKNELKDTFLQIHGDILSKADINEMYKTHKKVKALATLALINVEDPTPFSTVALDGDIIKEFVFKPRIEEAPSNIVNSGWAILEPEALDLIKDKEVCDIDKDIFKMLVSDGKLAGYLHRGDWFPIDTIEKYAIANANWS